MAYLMGRAVLNSEGKLVIEEIRILSSDNPTTDFDNRSTWVTIHQVERSGLSFHEATMELFQIIQSYYSWMPGLPKDYYSWLSKKVK